MHPQVIAYFILLIPLLCWLPPTTVQNFICAVAGMK